MSHKTQSNSLECGKGMWKGWGEDKKSVGGRVSRILYACIKLSKKKFRKRISSQVQELTSVSLTTG